MHHLFRRDWLTVYLSGITGSGGIIISEGHADAGLLNSTGSGHMDMPGVNFRTATAKISGSGNIKATVSDMLNVKIAGSGSVLYKGNADIDVDISGSGQVKKL